MSIYSFFLNTNAVKKIVNAYFDKKAADGRIEQSLNELVLKYPGLQQRHMTSLIGGVSKCVFDKKSGITELNGWFIPRAYYDKITIEQNNKILGIAILDQKRVDVYRDYPEYNEEYAGFCAQVSNKILDPQKEVTVNVYKGGQLLKSQTKTADEGCVKRRELKPQDLFHDKLKELEHDEISRYLLAFAKKDKEFAVQIIDEILNNSSRDKEFKNIEKSVYKNIANRVLIGGVSNCCIGEHDNILELRGWFAPRANYDKVVIEQSGKELGIASLGQLRQDVYDNYPYINDRKTGFSFRKKLGSQYDKTAEISIVVYQGGRVVDVFNSKPIITNTPKKPVQEHTYKDYLFSEKLDEYGDVSELKRAIRFNEIVVSLSDYMPWSEDVFWREFKNREYNILKGNKNVETEFVGIFSDKNVMFFKDAQIEYQYAESFWIIINEILINEEYYFETQNDRPVIIDCGANIGLAIYYFKHKCPSCRVVAFEPLAQEFAILRKNVLRNSWDGIQLHNVALGDVETEQEMIIPLNDSLGASLTNRPTEGSTSVPVITEKASVVRLERFISDYMHIDYLKMDIEGLEVRVLRSIREKLNKVDYVFCEYHYGETVEDNEFCELCHILDEAGFDMQVSKSPSFQIRTGKKTMQYVGKKCSLNIWAKNKSCK